MDSHAYPFGNSPAALTALQEKVAALSGLNIRREDFERLPEYSMSIPTGVVAGKRWKCNVAAFTVDGSGLIHATGWPALWVIREFVDAGNQRCSIVSRRAEITGADELPNHPPVVRRIYLASSWRNTSQPEVLAFLRGLGHEVYDFRHPCEGDGGFSWKEVDPNWESWTPAQYREALKSPEAERGFGFDFKAMQWCDTCVLLLPSGRSASFEFGWCVGAGKSGVVFMPEACEPELMYRGTTITITRDELAAALALDPKDVPHG